MTEQAGYMNQPDLIEECAKSLVEDEWGKYAWIAISFRERRMASRRAKVVMGVMRQRGLIDLQGLELIKQSGEAK